MTTFSAYQQTTPNSQSTINTFTFGLPTPLTTDRKPVSAPTSLKRTSIHVPPNSENLKQNSILSPECKVFFFIYVYIYLYLYLHINNITLFYLFVYGKYVI